MVYKSSIRHAASGGIIGALIATVHASDTAGLTYNNGVSGVGATFTSAVNTPLTIDGHTFIALDDILFIKDDTQSPSGAFNGLYGITQLQTVSLPLILTRLTIYNTATEIESTGAISVIDGTTNAGSMWLLNSDVVTIGVDPILYEVVKAPGEGTVGSVSVVTAHGFAGTVINPTTTPTITLSTTVTGILKADGISLLMAVSGIDYLDPTIVTGDVTFNSSSVSAIGSGKVTSAKLASGAAVANIGYTPVNQAGDTMLGILTLNADPVSALQAATKSYIDNFITGLTWKNAVQVATTANITLSGEQTIDGVLTSTSRVLVKNQSTQTQNGLYLSASGSWTRTTDTDTGPKLVNAAVYVGSGTLSGHTQWACSNTSITIGVTNITFAQIAGAGVYTNGTGITLTGNVFSIANNDISNALIRQSAGLSVIGNSTNSTANVADITAASDFQVLRRSGTAVGFGSVNLASSNAVTGLLAIANGGNNIGSQTTNGILFNNGTANTTSSNLAYSGGNLTITGTSASTGTIISTPSQLVYVSSLNGNDTTGNGGSSAPYATIAHALTSITTASITNPFCIFLDGSPFSLSSIVIKPNISIIGNGSIITNGASAITMSLDSTFLTVASNSFISDITFTSTVNFTYDLNTKSNGIFTTLLLRNLNRTNTAPFNITGISQSTNLVSSQTFLLMTNCFNGIVGTSTIDTTTLTNVHCDIANSTITNLTVDNHSSTAASTLYCKLSNISIGLALVLKATGTQTLLTNIFGTFQVGTSWTIDGVHSLVGMYIPYNIAPTLINSATFSPTSLFSGIINTSLTTDASSTTTGVIIAAGGLGIAKNAYIGGNVNIAGLTASNVVLTDSSKTLITVATLPLANGGLNANLTASNGGIFYSTASAGAILAGTATANQLFISGASSAPSWTSFYKDYGTANPSTTGGNLFIGTGCGSASITDNDSNTGVGVGCLNSISTSIGAGGGNTAVGFNALISLTSGVYNTSIGYATGSLLTTGSNNTFCGLQAGGARVSYNDCSFFGWGADASSSGLTNATAIGYNANESESNSITLGNTSVTKIKTTGAIISTNTTASSSSITGSGIFSGGIGVAKDIYGAGNINLTGATSKLTISTTAANQGLDLATADSYANLRVIQNTTGSDRHIYIGFGSGTTSDLRLYCNNNEIIRLTGGNVGILGAPSAGGGVGVVFVANAGTIPASNPTGGGILYVTAGALKYRGSSGTLTNLAPA